MEASKYYQFEQQIAIGWLKAIEDNMGWIVDGVRPTKHLSEFENPTIIEVMHTPGMNPEASYIARKDHKEKIIMEMYSFLLGARKCRWQWAITNLAGGILSNVEIYDSIRPSDGIQYDLETIWGWLGAHGYIGIFYIEDGELEYRAISGRNFGPEIAKIIDIKGYD